VPVLPRGGGTSQCGQTVGARAGGRRVEASQPHHRGRPRCPRRRGAAGDRARPAQRGAQAARAVVPGGRVDRAQATIGGMAGNNSCGARSIRYGNMVHNVAPSTPGWPTARRPISARAGGPRAASGREPLPRPRRRMIAARGARGGRDRARAGRLLRRVRRLQPRHGARAQRPAGQPRAPAGGLGGHARLLSRITPQAFAAARAQGAGRVPLPHLLRAMEAAQHIVKLDPDAVELVDRTMIDLARDNAAFPPDIVERFAASPERSCWSSSPATRRRAARAIAEAELVELMGDLGGLPGSVVEITDARCRKISGKCARPGSTS
jgi:hypothetical protein